MTTPTRPVRGIRQSIPTGTVLGRKSSGVGPAEPITIADLTNAVVATGGVVTTGGANPQQWAAGQVSSLGAGLTIVDGVLTTSSSEWSAGTVTALGTGLTLTSGTLEAPPPTQEWTAGTAEAIGAGLTLTGGTLSASIASIGSGLTLSSGTLSATGGTQEWTAGTVSAIGSGITLTDGTISASGGSGSSTSYYAQLVAGGSVETGAYAWRGAQCQVANGATINAINQAFGTLVSGATMQAAVVAMTGSTITAVEGFSSTIVVSETTAQFLQFSFPSPVVISTTGTYGFLFGRIDATGSTSTQSMFGAVSVGNINPMNTSPGFVPGAPVYYCDFDFITPGSGDIAAYYSESYAPTLGVAYTL